MVIEEQANRSSLLTKAIVDEFSRRGFEKSARGGYVSIQVYSLDSIPISEQSPGSSTPRPTPSPTES